MKKNKKSNVQLTSSRTTANIISGRMMIIIGFVPLIAMILCYLFKITDSEAAIRPLIRISLAILACYAFINVYKGRLSSDKIIFLIILSGIVMRVGYMMYTNWTQRMYDVGFLDEQGVGHGSYIINNILQGHLPKTNEYQFYHPPLYYILSGIVIKIAALFKHTTDYASLIKYAMNISCAASCITLIVIQKIMDELKVGRKYQIPAIALSAFFPNFILMGGRINNDSLVTLFMVLAIYFTIRWYYSSDIKDIIGIALSIGFGMMSKISCGTIAIFTGPIMLFKLYKAFKENKALTIITQLALFAIICFPLALWYPIRNYVLFGQSFNYVHDLGSNSHVYTGNISAVKRFFAVPLLEEFKQPFMNSSDDYSIFMIITRTAVFGEWNYDNVSKIVSVTLYYINLIMIIMSLVSMITVCLKAKKQDLFSQYSMAALWAIIFVSFMAFNIAYPFSCTADVRYIPPAVMAGMIYIAKAYETYDALSSVNIKRTVIFGKYLIAAYCLMVILMFA